jgi:hypothetical protein
VVGITEFSTYDQACILLEQAFQLSAIPIVEVAIHTILYVRQIYPADLFVRRRKYDTPVFQSRHPALNAYISGAVRAAGEEILLVSLSKHCSLDSY